MAENVKIQFKISDEERKACLIICRELGVAIPDLARAALLEMVKQGLLAKGLITPEVKDVENEDDQSRV